MLIRRVYEAIKNVKAARSHLMSSILKKGKHYNLDHIHLLIDVDL